MSVERKQALGSAPRAQAAAEHRPRVLHLLTSFEIGGTERQAVELLKRINLDRYDVRLAALRNEGPLYKDVEPRFPLVPEFRLTSFYNLNALKQFVRLRAMVTRERVDIIHAHDFYASLLAIAAARTTRARIIACQRHLKLSDRRVHDWGTRVIHQFAHCLLVNSEAIRDHIIKTGRASSEKIVVIRNGFDAESAAAASRSRDDARRELCSTLKIDSSAKLVGTVANLLPVKGHRFLLEAAAKVAPAHPQAHFVLIGDGPLKQELKDQAEQLAIADRVHFLGHRTDAARLAAAFDLKVLASLHEGLPNAVMEALAAGVPVVASAVGGCKELISDGQTGYLVAPADSAALAERISFALADRKGSAAMAERGRRFIMDRFDMQRMVSRTERLYDELMLESRAEQRDRTR